MCHPIETTGRLFYFATLKVEECFMALQFVRICVIAFAAAFCIAAHAEEGSAHKDIRSMPWIQNILNHADDLGMTADQKTKMNEIADSPLPRSKPEWTKVRERVETILSKEQREKIENLMRKQREEHKERNAEDNDDHK
jgi:hypothetical protein